MRLAVPAVVVAAAFAACFAYFVSPTPGVEAEQRSAAPARDVPVAAAGTPARIGPADSYQQAGLGFGDVGHVQCDQLRTSECAGEAQQEKCSIPQPRNPIRGRGNHAVHFCGYGRRLSDLGAAKCSPDAPQCCLDGLRVRWGIEMGQFMGVADRGDASAKGRGLGGLGFGSQEGCHRLAAGLQSGNTLPITPRP